MKFILDFDRVIFNWNAYNAAVKEHGLDDLFVDPRVWDTLTVSDYFYDDAVPFIEQCQKDNVIIISAITRSYGPRADEYQKAKLEKSGMSELVSEVVVMEGDKGPYVCERQGDTTIFVDDKLTHLQQVKRMCPSVHCLQMVRPDTLPENDTISTDPEIPVVQDFAAVTAHIQSL